MLRRSRSSCPSLGADARARRGGVMRIGGVIVVASLLAACSAVGPKPWEHDLMAKREMQPNPHPLLTSADDHMYFSKEGSSGGRSFAGGGCGCN